MCKLLTPQHIQTLIKHEIFCPNMMLISEQTKLQKQKFCLQTVIQDGNEGKKRNITSENHNTD